MKPGELVGAILAEWAKRDAALPLTLGQAYELAQTAAAVTVQQETPTTTPGAVPWADDTRGMGE